MRFLIFHAYLLRGTGSNVYNAELAQALAGLGHEVHILSQDREAAQLDWVNAVGTWGEDGDGEAALEVEQLRPAECPGSITAYRPDIGGLLPVFVADEYEGFRVKVFPEMSEEELEGYLAANVEAVRDVAALIGDSEAALANHAVMGPVILARAGLEFAAKIHGSDVSYTVRPHPERFVPYAREGLEAASAALVGSRHTAEDLWRTLEMPGLEEKTRLAPPGVDLEAFSSRPPEEAKRTMVSLVERLEGGEGGGDDEFGRDAAEAAEALRWFADASGPRVLFVGKLIVSKGVDLLLAGWPLVARVHPEARLLLVGFGEYREGLERLWAALERGDLADAEAIAAAGRALEGNGEPEVPLPILSSFLARAGAGGGYAGESRAAAGTVAFSGRLEHDEVARVMPAVDAFVMPSTFPEAFGMVAAEAAACGVPPVSAHHSGMREVSARLAEATGPELEPLLSFEVAEGAPSAIAERINGWLGLTGAESESVGEALSKRVAELWGWEGVARGVVAASAGKLDELSPVPDS
ncbi:MAG: glycosyltransferase [Solirubrobacterales bacterium]|nr:glycosyltransferase [Solirubrobacterales bacterium]